jgi:hypothetical protein
MGVFSTLFYTLAVVLPTLAGHVAGHIGSASVTFLLGAACLLGALPLVVAFRRSRPGAAEPA